jgi:hypothetical protein
MITRDTSRRRLTSRFDISRVRNIYNHAFLHAFPIFQQIELHSFVRLRNPVEIEVPEMYLGRPERENQIGFLTTSALNQCQTVYGANLYYAYALC